MANVRLSKGVRLPSRGLLFPGTVIDASDAELEIIEAAGASAPVEDAPQGEKRGGRKPQPKADAGTGDSKPQRPKNAEKQEVWEAYARKLGIDPKGMDKQEIINATKWTSTGR